MDPKLGDAYVFEGWYDEKGNPVNASTLVNGPLTVTARLTYLPKGGATKTDGGVTVTASWGEGVFPEGTAMKLDPQTRDKALSMAEKALAEGYEAVDGVAVDITFVYDGKSIQPETGKSVTIKMTLSSPLEGSQFFVLHEKTAQPTRSAAKKGARAVKSSGSGGVETISATSTETGASFSGSSFSVYAIVGADYTDDHDPAPRRTYIFYDGEPTKLVSQWNERTRATYVNGETLELPPTPAGDSKHDFDGWYLANQGGEYREPLVKVTAGEVDLSSLTKDETVYVYAKFEERFKITCYTDADKSAVFTVILAADGETKQLPTAEEAAAGLNLAELVAFKGWKKYGESDTNIVSQVTIEGADVEVVPVLVTHVLVTFDVQNIGGPVPDSQAIPKGTEAEAPTTDPSDGDYTFGGWYTTPECTGDPFDFDTPISENTVLYAKWTPKNATYTIKVWKEKANGASDDYDLQTITRIGGVGDDLTDDDNLVALLAEFLPAKGFHINGSGAGDVGNRQNDTAFDWKDSCNAVIFDSGAEYNYQGAEKKAGDTTIAVDGSTVVNLYYSRDTYKLFFRFDMEISENIQGAVDGISGGLRLKTAYAAHAPNHPNGSGYLTDISGNGGKNNTTIIRYGESLYQCVYLKMPYIRAFMDYIDTSDTENHPNGYSPWYFTKNWSDGSQTVFNEYNQTLHFYPREGKTDDGTGLTCLIHYDSNMKSFPFVNYYYEGETVDLGNEDHTDSYAIVYQNKHAHEFEIGSQAGGYTLAAVTNYNGGEDAEHGILMIYDRAKTGFEFRTEYVKKVDGKESTYKYYFRRTEETNGESAPLPLHIHWVKAPYKITFVPNDTTSSFDGVQVKDGQETTTFYINDPISGVNTRGSAASYDAGVTTKVFNGALYRFEGWTRNGELFDFTEQTMPNHNLTFYGKWTELPFKVIFHPENGGAETSKDVAAGGKVAKEAAPTNGDLAFLGWYLTPQPNRDGASNTPFDFDTLITSDLVNENGELHLYARWQGTEEYTVQYDKGDHGELSAELTAQLNDGKDTATYLEGSKASVKGVAVGKVVDGKQYVFTGWKIADQGELLKGGATFDISAENDAADGSTDHNIVLVAQYEKIDPTKPSITYHANYPSGGDATSLIQPENTAVNGDYTIDQNADSCSFSAKGYRFVCWATEGGKATQIFDPKSGPEYFYPGETVALGQGDNDLYAVWMPLIEITVTKDWDDADDQDGIRPDEITVELVGVKDKAPTLTLNEKNGWKGTFTDLDMYDDKGEIAYTVKETKVPDGYTVAYAPDKVSGADGTITVTNTHTPETIEVSGKKTWDDADDQDGKRPKSITIHLLADGAKIGSVTVTEAMGWKWSFRDLPKSNNGKAIVYTIAEDAVEGYTAAIEGYNVTNVHIPATVSLTVKKVWNDSNDAARKRSGVEAKIVLRKTVNGVSTQVDAMEVGHNKGWTYTWEDLPAYEKGAAVTYSVKEELVKPNGYKSDTTKWKTVADGETITIKNTYRDPDITPGTGDSRKTLLWAGLMLTSALGCAAALLAAKRKKNKEQ